MRFAPSDPASICPLTQVASIICFASIAGWEDSFTVEVGCGPSREPEKVTVDFEYPFELDLVKLEEPICRGKRPLSASCSPRFVLTVRTRSTTR